MIILSSWGTPLFVVVAQVSLQTYWFPTQQEMEAENQQKLNLAIEYVNQQAENQHLLEGRIARLELLYTEDWQRSIDHRKIVVHYTLKMNLDGKLKTVLWGQGDPQAEATILDNIRVTILRYDVPVNIYD